MKTIRLSENEVKLIESSFASYLASLQENQKIAEFRLESNPDLADDEVRWYKKEIDSLMELASKINPV